MKFSIRNLESARNNAKAFGNKLIKEGLSSGNFGGYPKSVRWLDAVIEYHQTSDITKAFSLLEKKFSHRKDTPKNQREVVNLLSSLDNYIKEYKKLGYIHLEHKFNINLKLSNELSISGWIWLLEMTIDGGRAGFFVSKSINNDSWKDELKFPVIQHYIARELYNTDLEDVEVGVIDFWNGSHHKNIYDDDEIDTALDELKTIGNTITSLL